jgi:hypothetical protein
LNNNRDTADTLLTTILSSTIKMNVIFRYIIISIFVATLIAAGNILPGGYAQSSSTPSPKSACPNGGSPIGLMCVLPQPYKLPLGTWKLEVNGIGGILNITSVDSMGKIQGTMYGGQSQSNVTVVCPVAHPCTIDGSFDGKTGKLSFKSTPTIEFRIPIPFQNYTGYLSKKVMIDFIVYTLAGTGRSFLPDPSPEFGWYATINCIAGAGCLRG